MAPIPKKGEVFDFSKTLAGDDAVGMLAKLVWEGSEILAAKDTNPSSRMFRSANAASAAWHIHEWLWKCSDRRQEQALLDAVEAPTRNFAGYVIGIQRKSGALAICRQIATAGKHFGIKHNRDDIGAEVVTADSGEVNVYFIWGGHRILDIDVYGAAFQFWVNAYVDLGLKHAESLRDVAAWTIARSED